MTPRERFIAALDRRPLTGRVPHFELVFFLTMEAFGKVHPWHRNYEQWNQMTETERELHLEDMADVYIMTARRYEHSAIFIQPMYPPHIDPDIPTIDFEAHLEEDMRLIDVIRNKTGGEFFLMLHGDVTYAIPSG